MSQDNTGLLLNKYRKLQKYYRLEERKIVMQRRDLRGKS